MSSIWLLLIAILGIRGVPTAIGQGGMGEPQPASRTGESGSGEGYYCRIPEMPISWATRKQPVVIVHSDAVFSELGTTVPALDVRNAEPLPITNLAFVVEYLDSQGNRSTTAVIAAAAAGYEKSAPLPFSVENIASWKEPLGPGQTARVGGFYDSVRTITCPAAGRITFVLARFKNGSVEKYEADGWLVPPLPRFVPEITAACPIVQENPTQILAKLRISSTGEVTGISGPVLTRDSPDLVAWIATQMKLWTFQPTLLDGRPLEDDLDVEFVIFGNSLPNLAAISLTSPATLIVFYPANDAAGRCVENFGFLHEAMTIP
jgi:hypothetical protein